MEQLQNPSTEQIASTDSTNSSQSQSQEITSINTATASQSIEVEQIETDKNSQTPGNNIVQFMNWRSTDHDGYVPVRDYNFEVRELQQNDLKDTNYDVEKIVTSDITRNVEKFQPKQFAYSHTNNCYVQIKKYDEVRKIYICRPKRQDKNKNEQQANDKDMELQQTDLSEQITVNLRILTDEQTCSGQIQVGINDKIKNLKEYHSGKGQGNLTPIYKNELIKGEDTFIKRLVQSGDNFLLICGGFEPIKWTRFATMEFNSYFHMSDNYYEAVAFKPKQDVHFLGFGFFNQHEKQAFKFKFKYIIDGEESAEIEVDATQEMVQEDKILKIDFQELGVDTVFVKAESLIHILAKSQPPSTNRFNYGYEGYNPENIAGNNPHFTTERSDHNQNSTSVDFGQFPYILYAV
eukprot:403376975